MLKFDKAKIITSINYAEILNCDYFKNYGKNTDITRHYA